MSHSRNATYLRRARRSFWILVVVTVLAVGSLSEALSAKPTPATGLRVAGSGLLILISGTLAARVLLAVSRANSRARNTSTSARS